MCDRNRRYGLDGGKHDSDSKARCPTWRCRGFLSPEFCLACGVVGMSEKARNQLREIAVFAETAFRCSAFMTLNRCIRKTAMEEKK